MKRIFVIAQIVMVLLLATPILYAGQCEDSGGCTLSGGACGVQCGGQCLPLAEAKCCMSGMCYRNGSWCGGVECNGACMSPAEAKCCLSGCRYVSGNCQCGNK